MMVLELTDPEKRDIKQIMLDAYRATGSEASAAQSMGITQQAYNDWKYRLKLEKKIDEIAFSLKHGVSIVEDENKPINNDTGEQD